MSSNIFGIALFLVYCYRFLTNNAFKTEHSNISFIFSSDDILRSLRPQISSCSLFTHSQQETEKQLPNFPLVVSKPAFLVTFKQKPYRKHRWIISITLSCCSSVILLSLGRHSPLRKISAPTSTPFPAM